MPILIILFAAFANASESSLTLPFESRLDGQRRILRPLPECQWAEKDLVHSVAPNFTNTGTGAVLRLLPKVRIKTMGRNRKTRWEKAEYLTAYAEKNILERYAELAKKHENKRNYFYEDEANLKNLLETGRGFRLDPGSLLVSIGDASLMRYLFGAPAFEFRVLEPVEIEGEVVYRPTVRRGALPMEVIEQSAEIVYGSSEATLTGLRAEKRTQRCKDGLEE